MLEHFNQMWYKIIRLTKTLPNYLVDGTRYCVTTRVKCNDWTASGLFKKDNCGHKSHKGELALWEGVPVK